MKGGLEKYLLKVQSKFIVSGKNLADLIKRILFRDWYSSFSPQKVTDTFSQVTFFLFFVCQQ
uniref:Uncharacterized protein n=1 Tax=Lepeophtheirus salmonis TaxID=72036 RepID=A0A0K2TE52_LEPSM